MSTGELLHGLFSAYAKADDATFRQVAEQIIADARRKNHRTLSADLERALDYGTRPGATIRPTLRPLPRGKDDRPLLRLTKPGRTFSELVLPPQVRELLDSAVEENLRRSVLLGHGLHPRQRLLFVGPPGTGKSITAQAIAAELSLPVAVASLAALTSSLLGETARNIEAVVRFAEQTPCVLLFDEFDVMGQERSHGGDHGELRRVAATVLQLLEDLHGESVVIATSNHPTLLDNAVWRRFDEIITFSALPPDRVEELLRLRLKSLHLGFAISDWVPQLAEFSPAEIELICFDALRRTVLDGSDTVDASSFARAVERMHARAVASAQA